MLSSRRDLFRAFGATWAGLLLPYEPARVYSFGEDVGRIIEPTVMFHAHFMTMGVPSELRDVQLLTRTPDGQVRVYEPSAVSPGLYAMELPASIAAGGLHLRWQGRGACASMSTEEYFPPGSFRFGS